MDDSQKAPSARKEDAATQIMNMVALIRECTSRIETELNKVPVKIASNAVQLDGEIYYKREPNRIRFPGNTIALYKALTAIAEWREKGYIVIDDDISDIPASLVSMVEQTAKKARMDLDGIQSALDSKPRNCDVYATPEAAEEAYHKAMNPVQTANLIGLTLAEWLYEEADTENL